jgi:hypothetical protein
LPVAVIVGFELVAVNTVVIVNVALVAPAATVTDAGAVAAEVLFEDKVTVIPPVGAGPLSVTVPVEGVPAVTVVGLSERADTVGEFTVRVAFSVTAPAVAEIVTDFAVVTAVVVAVNVAEVDPAAIVTKAGTVVEASLDARLTVKPPVGAAPVIVTDPVVEFPPVTVVGFRLNALRAGA